MLRSFKKRHYDFRIPCIIRCFHIKGKIGKELQVLKNSVKNYNKNHLDFLIIIIIIMSNKLIVNFLVLGGG